MAMQTKAVLESIQAKARHVGGMPWFGASDALSARASQCSHVAITAQIVSLEQMRYGGEVAGFDLRLRRV